MALKTDGDAPTLDDARRAAQALIDAGVGEVWLYGSVARGEAGPCSDIDLVAVLDHLEYRERSRNKKRLDAVAERACGRHVEAMVTDRAEWRIQREDVSGSFVSAISDDLMYLAGYPVPDGVDWNKAQVMASSDEDLARERIRSVLLHLTKIDTAALPSTSERELAELDDPGDYLMARGGRLVVVCEAADMGVENAAKAVAVLSDVKAQTLWTHDVRRIVADLDAEDASAFMELMAAAPELVKSPDYVTMWRNRGAYGTPTEGMTAQEVATPAFARAIGLIACDVAAYAADFLERRIGAHTDIDDVRRWSIRVKTRLNTSNLATGNPL